jgi:hypothetical protein
VLGYEGGLGCFARTDGPIEKHLAFAFGHLLSVAETIGKRGSWGNERWVLVACFSFFLGGWVRSPGL